MLGVGEQRAIVYRAACLPGAGEGVGGWGGDPQEMADKLVPRSTPSAGSCRPEKPVSMASGSSGSSEWAHPGCGHKDMGVIVPPK